MLEGHMLHPCHLLNTHTKVKKECYNKNESLASNVIKWWVGHDSVKKNHSIHITLMYPISVCRYSKLRGAIKSYSRVPIIFTNNKLNRLFGHYNKT